MPPPPSPKFRESKMKIDRVDKKVIFIPYEIYFLNENYSDSDMSCDVLSYETVKFKKRQVILELYADMYGK